MRKILQKFFPERLVFFQQFDLSASLLGPCFYIFPYFIYTFLRENVFIIHLLFFTRLCLVDEFVNEFDLSVNKILDDAKDQKIAANEYDYKRNKTLYPVLFQKINTEADRYGKNQCGKSG